MVDIKVNFERRYTKAEVDQPQKILLMGRYKKAEAIDNTADNTDANTELAAEDPIKAGDFFQLDNAADASKFGESSELLKMAASAFKAYPDGDISVLVLGESADSVSLTGDNNTLLESIPELHFNQIALSLDAVDDLKAMDKWLDDRWKTNGAPPYDGRCFVGVKMGKTEAIAKYSEAVESGQKDVKLNHKHITLMVFEDSESEACEWAASLAATVAREAQEPFRPFQTLELVGISAPKKPFKSSDRLDLTEHGLSTFTSTTGKVFIDYLVSTYRYLENDTTVKDDSYSDINTMMILSAFRYGLIRHIKKKFPRHGLAKAGFYETPVVSPDSLKPEVIVFHQAYVEKSYFEENDFDKTLQIKTVGNKKIEISMYPLVMGQFRKADMTVFFEL